MEQMRGNLDELLTLQLQVRDLKEENACLQQDRTNADLLRYQVQGLEKKSDSIRGLEEEVTSLRLMNRKLLEGGGSKTGESSETVQLQLASLQQREALAVQECGSLTTEYVSDVASILLWHNIALVYL